MPAPPPESASTSALVAALRAALPADAVLASPGERRVYDCDGQTLHRAPPDVVVLPRNHDEVVAAVRVARDHRAAVIPRGAGTGLSGGTLAPHGGVLISTARMNRILAIDRDARRARVEPGVVNARLTEAVRPLGLRYAPDPSSQTSCTIGGNVAENSGGPHTLRLGVTVNHLTGLTIVTPDGETLRLGECAGDGTGGPADDALIGVFTGSEGMFGIATEAVVRLVPVPEAVRTLLAAFPDVPAAGRAVSAVLSSGVVPAAVELMDRLCIEAVEAFAHAGLPAGAGAVLLIEIEGAEAAIGDDERDVRAALATASPLEVRSAATEDERARLWKARKQAAGALGRICRGFYTHDGCVPPSRLAEALARIGAISADHGIRVATLAHAGDGNIHPLFLFDTLAPEELARGAAAGRAALATCIELGGSLTGEHGIGGEKRDLLPMQYDAATIALFARVRRAFDPDEQMNPGKMFPAEGPATGPAAGLAGTKAPAGWL